MGRSMSALRMPERWPPAQPDDRLSMDQVSGRDVRTLAMPSPSAFVPSILQPAYAVLVDLLAKDYFLSVTNDGLHRFTGAHFETLSGPWNDPETRNVITAGDLAAVSCLSVEIPGAAAVRILEDQAQEISGLLNEMPRADETLWDVPEEAVADPKSPASQLWRLLRTGRDGLGPTTTSKLMARKRANLIPIFDSVLGDALRLQSSKGHWLTMRRLMLSSDEDQPLHERLAGSARRVGLPATVTPLRVFDVVVWYAYNPRPKVQSWVRKIQDAAIAEGQLEQRWDPSES